MKKISIILLIIIMALTGCQNSVADNNDQLDSTSNELTENGLADAKTMAYESIFQEDVLHEISVNIDEASWAAILADPTAETFYSADITVDGVTVENVAFRTKGNSTLRDVANSDSDRYSFKFKINEYEDQKLLGLDEFVINNMFSDASYMREHLSYEAFQAVGGNVSLSSYSNVYVNDELIGLYLMVESVDDSFLNRVYGHNDGNLYRMDQGSTLAITGDTYFENSNQKNGDDESKTDLYELMTALNNMPDGEKGDIERVLDVESALVYIAGNMFLESYDSLNGQHAQNYYLYNDDGVFSVIPWDYNMSFGTFGGSGASTVDIDEPVLGTTIDQVPLIENLLEVDEYKERYYEILQEFISYFDDLETQVSQLKALIEPSVIKDPTKFSTLEDFYSSTIYQEDGLIESNLMSNGNNETPEQDRLMANGPISEAPGQNPPGQIPPGQNVPGENMPEQGDLGANQMPKDDVNQQDRPAPNQLPNINGRPQNNNTMGGNGVSIINILQGSIENILSQLD